jgi:hypothetical protein
VVGRAEVEVTVDKDDESSEGVQGEPSAVEHGMLIRPAESIVVE